MNLQDTVLGTLNPDGTLELDNKPSVAPGRVQVLLQAMPTGSAKIGLAEVVQQIRQDQLARGYHGMTASERAARAALQDEENDDYEARWAAIWKETTTGSPK